MQTIFINLETTFERAMSYRQGAQMQAAYMVFNGVQLLPEQNYPYIQRTNAVNGIEITSFTVKAMSICGNEIADITDCFAVVSSFMDSETGLNQLYWSLTNLPELGEQLIYLHINTGADGNYYSSPFMITAEEHSEVFHYRNKQTDVMQSTGLQMYFRQYSDNTDISSYTTINRKQQIVQDMNMVEYEIYETTIQEYGVLKLFKRLNMFRYRYMGFQRFNLIEVPEAKQFTGNENMVQNIIKVQRDSKDIYNPFYVQPVPPPPPPVYITLNKVTNIGSDIGGKKVIYNYTFTDIEPTALTYQWSEDQINWFDATSGVGEVTDDGSRNWNVGINGFNTSVLYFRIYSPQYDTYSNIVQILPPNINLIQVYSNDPAFNTQGNTYFYEFELNNFAPNTQLKFDVSVDGVTWAYTSAYLPQQGNNSPKKVKTLSSSLQFKYFRIRYISQDFAQQITSNIAFHQF